MWLLLRGPDHRERTPLALAYLFKRDQILRRNRHHIPLLRFVTPRLQRTQTRLSARDRIQVKAPATAAVLDQLRKRIRQPTRAHIVDECDRIFSAALPASIDDLLRSALHLRVIALHRSKVQIRISAAHAARSRTAAKPNQHCRSAQYNQRVAGLHRALLDMLCANIPQPAGQHDRLVISEDRALPSRIPAQLLIRAEVSAQRWPAKLIVVRRRTQRPLDHDVERRSNVRGPSIRSLPRLRCLRQIQIRHRKPAQTSLRLRSASGRTFVANLTARSRRRTRPRRDRRRMIVRLNLQQNVDVFFVICVRRISRLRKEPPTMPAADHRSIIAIGREHILARHLIRIANHLEQRSRLLHPRFALGIPDRPACIEYLVAAVFAVGLREHIQLNVGRIAPQSRKLRDKILDLIGRKRQAQLPIGGCNRRRSEAQHVDMSKLLLLSRCKQRLQLVGALEEDALGHAIMQRPSQRADILRAPLAGGNDAHHARTLDPLDRPKARVVQNIGRLARPRRLGTHARRDPHALPRRYLHTGAQQLGQSLVIDRALRLLAQHQQVQIRRLDCGDACRLRGVARAQFIGHPFCLERRQRRRPRQHPDHRGARGGQRDFL